MDNEANPVCVVNSVQVLVATLHIYHTGGGLMVMLPNSIILIKRLCYITANSPLLWSLLAAVRINLHIGGDYALRAWILIG